MRPDRRRARALVTALVAALLTMLLSALAAAPAAAAPRVISARIAAPDHLQVRFSEPIANLAPENFRVASALAPDVPIPVREVRTRPGNRLTLVLGAQVSSTERYRLDVADPPLHRAVNPPMGMILLSVLLASALIQNFVFTRYLGLCVFFGVSKKRDTAIGMGVTFTLVMVLSGMLSWALDTWVLRPLHLSFLQIIVFIGVVAFLVQLLDTVLHKTHPVLFRKFGIYLVLITTNCIILAVPLLNATANSGPVSSFALALGSGLGFALALFLMSSAREKMELARVPKVFEGLPIAFALTGLFALAFMGFSGLDFFR